MQLNKAREIQLFLLKSYLTNDSIQSQQQQQQQLADVMSRTERVMMREQSPDTNSS